MGLDSEKYSGEVAPLLKSSYNGEAEMQDKNLRRCPATGRNETSTFGAEGQQGTTTKASNINGGGGNKRGGQLSPMSEFRVPTSYMSHPEPLTIIRTNEPQEKQVY